MRTRQTIKRLFEPVQADKKSYVIATALYCVWQSFGIIQTIVLAEMTSSLTQSNLNHFWNILLGFIVFNIIYHIVNFLTRDKSRMPCLYSILKYLREKYYIQYINSDNTMIEKFGTGKMISIINNGIDTRKDLMIQGHMKIVEIIIQLLFVIYVVSQIGIVYLIAFIAFSLLTQYGVNHIATRANIRRQKRRDTRDEISRQDVKILMSKFEILSQSRTAHEMKALDDMYSKSKYYDIQQNRYEHIGYNIPSLSFIIIKLSLFVIAAYTVHNSQSQDYGQLVLILGATGVIEKAIRDLSDFQKNRIKSIQRVYKLWDTFDNIPPITGITEGKDFYYQGGDIILSHISFAYDLEKPVFSNFSLDIKGGTKTALVGESGGGKTTLIKLIAGYMKPGSGDIVIDGQQLSETKLSDYYRYIGYLTQEPSVFDGTVYENLVYGLPTKEKCLTPLEKGEIGGDLGDIEKQINEVISLSRCEFIYDLPQGINTEIGERGVRLSGGQKQRLAIAKIMLKNPNIILLDEPTSALDSFNEELVSQALTNLFAGKTVIVVAHRLQTVKNSDRILYIDGGKVLEEGNHESLIALGGKYKKMLDLQSGF